ncbi:phosphatase PAP2 family protein [Kaarinaea lacus]
MKNINPVNLASPWIWAIPLISLSGLTITWLSDSNENLFLLLNSLGKSDGGALFWANATILGDTLMAFTLLSLFVRRRPDVIWALLIAALFAALWVHGLKYVIGEARPGAVLAKDVINVIGVSLRGGSFPSGHTTTAFVLAGVICLLRVNPVISWLAIGLATLAGIARAVVGAHWPIDIFAGALGGWLTAIIGVMLFQRLASYKQWQAHVPGQLVFNIGLLVIAINQFFYDNGYPASLPFQYTVAAIAILVVIYNLSKIITNNKRREATRD